MNINVSEDVYDIPLYLPTYRSKKGKSSKEIGIEDSTREQIIGYTRKGVRPL